MLPLPWNVGGSQFGRASASVIVPASLRVLHFHDLAAKFMVPQPEVCIALIHLQNLECACSGHAEREMWAVLDEWRPWLCCCFPSSHAVRRTRGARPSVRERQRLRALHQPQRADIPAPAHPDCAAADTGHCLRAAHAAKPRSDRACSSGASTCHRGGGAELPDREALHLHCCLWHRLVSFCWPALLNSSL